MAEHGPTLHSLRNIGIVAHINAGKTTLTERMLFDTGKQAFMGDVEAGTATMDWMTEEQDRGISITAAVTSVQWRGFHLNLVDTPGHVDFTVEVERCLRVLDGVVVLLDGVRGVESQTETVWWQAVRNEVPRLVFVNKLDRDASDFTACVLGLEEQFGCHPVPIVLPLRQGRECVGLLDVISGTPVLWGELDAQSTGLLAELQRASRAAVVEACADFDATVLEDFVDGREVDDERLCSALRRGTIRGELVPVVCGSALDNHGVNLLLDNVCRYLPAPLDIALPAPLVMPADARLDRLGCTALVFKVHFEDEQSLAFVRVYTGELRPGMVLETCRGDKVDVGELWRMHAMRQDLVKTAGPGEIVALTVSRAVHTGDTLRLPGSEVELESIQFAEPVVTRTVEPKLAEDLPLLEAKARQIAAEDPTLRLRQDAVTGVLLVSGMGELHLEVFGSRLDAVLPGKARFGRPSVACCETVAAPAEAVGECTRTLGAVTSRARVRVEVEPSDPSAAVVVTAAGPCPGLPLDEILVALRTRAKSGFVGLHPGRGMTVRVLDGDLDGDPAVSAILALEAAELATRRAMSSGGVLTLEPIMRFEVRCPSESATYVLADLRGRNALIRSVTADFESTQIAGLVPLERVLGYATPLRSKTQGKGTLALTLDRFASDSDSSAKWRETEKKP